MKRNKKITGANVKEIGNDLYSDDYTRTFDDVYITPKGLKVKNGSYTLNNLRNIYGNPILELSRKISLKSGGDYGISGFLNGLIGVLRGMDKPYRGDYNGIINLENYGDGFGDLRPSNTDGANAIDLSFRNNETGFEKIKGDTLMSDGEIIGDPNAYYKYRISPIDTFKLNYKLKPVIDSIANTKNIYAFNLDGLTNDVDPQLFSDKEWFSPIIDADNASMSLKNDKIRFFDNWDNGWLYNMTAKLIPTFIHDVPIKYGDYSDRDLKILRNMINLLEESVHDDMREFKLYDTLDSNIKSYKDGKSIQIKPSKRGTFTAAAKAHGASVAEFERRVLKNPEKYSKAMRKKAQFSHNARSWKH